MKKILMLLSLMVITSTYASEVCNVGYTCEEISKDEVILREVRSFNDEGLEFCDTITIKNFGQDQSSCQRTADVLNSLPSRN